MAHDHRREELSAARAAGVARRPAGGRARRSWDEKASLVEAALENMDQGLMMINADGIVQVYNSKVLELLDLPEELLARRPSFQEVRRHQVERDEFAKCDEAFRHWVSESEVKDAPHTYERERPDGRIIEFRTVPLPGGGAVRTYTDITARRKAEAELRYSEERYRLAARATNDVLWDWDLVMDEIYWNEAVETLFGYKKEDIEPRSSWWDERIHPRDRERVVSSVRTAIERGAARWSEEYAFRRADGTYADVLDRGSVMADPGGKPLRMVGAISDETDRKRAEQALHESEARYRLLAENATDIISRTDLNGHRTYISPACRDILGYEPEEMMGGRPIEVVHPDDLPAVAAGLKALQAGTVDRETITYRVPHKDGHWVWIEARRRLVRDREGRPCEVVSVLRDVTERRMLEERLRQSQKMEAIGQLTGGVAHDFNNLLTVILGNAELLGGRLKDPNLNSLARMIQTAAEHGGDLTQKLLAFGRRQSLRPERLLMDELVRGMLPLLRRTIGEHIELRARLGDGKLLAIVDRGLFESALINLAVNARDAMPNGGVLTISTCDRAALAGEGSLPIGQPVVSITISDTGTGMSPEVLERAFEPFFTTKPMGEGTGLGLSMVYGFAEQSGGHVSIESRLGEGTSVTILLLGVETRIADPPVVDDAPSAPAGGGERVLVVEDEPQVLAFVSSQLQSLGYRVTGVSSALDALEILEQDQGFDLLFTDVVLPYGVSGIDLARRIREMGLDTKVLFTSGYSEAFLQHGRPDENTLLLRKPYKRKELAEIVRKSLDRGS